MLIMFDYLSAIRQAGRVEEAAESVRNLANRDVETIINELEAFWQGESAQLFYSKCRELQTELRETTNDLNRVAQNIRSRSEAMRRAEEAAAHIAQNAGH